MNTYLIKINGFFVWRNNAHNIRDAIALAMFAYEEEPSMDNQKRVASIEARVDS